MESIPCESSCKNKGSSVFETLTTFKRESSIVGKDLINTDKFWNGVPRPEVLLWGTVPLVVQERMLEEINKKLVNDRAVADLELLQYRYEPILRNSSKLTTRHVI